MLSSLCGAGPMHFLHTDFEKRKVNTQMLSGMTNGGQKAAHADVMHVAVPAVLTYCAAMKPSVLSKQFLTEIFADPEVVAAAPLLQTQAAPGVVVDGQALVPAVTVPEHVHGDGLLGLPWALQSVALAPVHRKYVRPVIAAMSSKRQ